MLFRPRSQRYRKSIEHASDESTYEVVSQSTIDAPMLSVVVPVYNMMQNDYLRQCYESLRAQALDGMEIVFVDDASTDESLACMSDIAAADPSVTVVRMIRNSRQGAARNRGIVVAKGAFVGFLDPDDVVMPGYYEQMLHLALETGADVVAAPYRRVDESLKPLEDPIYQISEAACGVLDSKRLQENMISPGHVWTKIYRRSLIVDNGLFFPEGIWYEDNPTCFFWAVATNSIEQLPARADSPCYLYRQRTNSVDHDVSQMETRLKDRLDAALILLDEAEAHPELDEVKYAYQKAFMKLYYLNSLSMLSHSDSGWDEDDLRVMKDVVSTRVPTYIATCSPKSEGMRSFLQVRLALNHPKAYIKMRKIKG